MWVAAACIVGLIGINTSLRSLFLRIIGDRAPLRLDRAATGAAALSSGAVAPERRISGQRLDDSAVAGLSETNARSEGL